MFLKIKHTYFGMIRKRKEVRGKRRKEEQQQGDED